MKLHDFYFTRLSTVSSSINALAAVTVEDLIKPYFTLTEIKLSWISMGMSKYILIFILNLSYLKEDSV